MEARRLWTIVIGLLAFVMLGAGLLMLQEKKSDHLILAFLDVGQGDAILISKMGEYDVLIDGGPDPIVLRRLAEVMPWYDREIDLIFLSHNHADHYQGLLAVLDKYQVGQMIVSALAEPLPQEVTEALERSEVSYSKMPAGTEIELEPDVRLKALWPSEEVAVSDINDRSLVLQLEVGQLAALLAGDAGEAVERELLDKKLVQEVEIFKLSHHGSDTSNSQDFLVALSPQWVVAQNGQKNSFGHPNRRILKRAQRVGAEVLRNDQQGTIIFEANGEEWQRLR